MGIDTRGCDGPNVSKSHDTCTVGKGDINNIFSSDK